MDNDGTPTFDVIVIGGGLAGLCAAWQIQKRDPELKILVLEAKDRLGGRTLTETLPVAHGTDSWDVGGQWVASSHKNMLDLLFELNLEVFPQYTTGKKLIQFTNEPIKCYKGSIPDLSLPTLLDMEHGLGKVDSLGIELSVDDYYDDPKAAIFDGLTVENLSGKYLWTDAAMRMFNLAVETVFGISSRQMSALFFLRYSGTAGGFRRLIETSKNCAQELRVKGGTQQISQMLASKLGETNVKLSSPVTGIKQYDLTNLVSITTKTGVIYNCKRAIIAIPLPQNAHIEYDPPLPTDKIFCFRNMPMGNLVKFIAVYNKPFWRERGFSGEILNEGKFDDSFEALDVVFDGTSCNGNPALVCFQSAQRGLWWSAKKENERKQAVLETLARFLGDEALAPISFLEKNWYNEPYNGGCPSAICGPGVMKNFQSWNEPFGRLHWAGTETANVWMGYMEGAVASGKRVALEVLRLDKPELLTELELSQFLNVKQHRRRSHFLLQTHKVFRYTIGLALMAIGIIVVKKMYFRIAL